MSKDIKSLAHPPMFKYQDHIDMDTERRYWVDIATSLQFLELKARPRPLTTYQKERLQKARRTIESNVDTMMGIILHDTCLVDPEQLGKD
jgi:hypothetical protein